MKLLLVEDNRSIIEGLLFALEAENYRTDYRTTMKEAKEYLAKNRPDLIILDYMLPDGNGFILYEQVIKELQIPTIFLTARDDEETVVRGLTIGAEDYVTKPFSTKELLARMQKILLREQQKNQIRIDNLLFDVDKMVCYKEGAEIPLSALEIQLLFFLIQNLNKTVSRSRMLDKIWELTGNFVDDHTVTTYLNRIRKKLGTALIKTVKGIGYLITDEK